MDWNNSLGAWAHQRTLSIFKGLREHANAEDLNLQDRSAIAWFLIRTFRLVFVAVWILSMTVLFHVSATTTSRKMIEQRAEVLDRPDTREIEEKEAFYDEKIPVSDSDETSKFHIERFHQGRIAQELRRFARGLILSLVYYSSLFGLLILVDAGLQLQSIKFRCIAFVVCSALLAPLHMLWIENLIEKELRAKMLSMTLLQKTFSKYNYGALVLPSFLFSGSQILALAIPVLVALVIPQPRLFSPAAVLFSLVLEGLALALALVFIVLPPAVFLTRVEASLIADETALDIVDARRLSLPTPIQVKGRGISGCGKRLLSIIKSIDFSVLYTSLKWSSVCGAAFVANIIILATF